MKIKITNLTCLILILFVLTILGCKYSKEADAELIKSIEQKRINSLVEANMEIAKTIHSDEFQLITPDGTEYDKQQYLGHIEKGILDYEMWEAGNIKVRMYDDVAVIRYIDKDFRVLVNGELARSGILKHTNLYEKRNGQWQIVWSHASGGEESE